MKTYDSFDSWVRAQPQRYRGMIGRLRKLVRSVAPRLDETSKWGNGCWVKGDLPILYLRAKRDHMEFGFFAGATLSDPKRLLRGKGKFVRHVRIESPGDIDESALPTLIRKSVQAPAYR